VIFEPDLKDPRSALRTGTDLHRALGATSWCALPADHQPAQRPRRRLEALLRWNHQRGLVAPSEFIPWPRTPA
jgi:EAL domain-containing protein (putative c-di-GMP-specific phosphodiesterase class I)